MANNKSLNSKNKPDIHSIFPKRSKEECLSELRKDSRLFSKYQSLDETWRKAFMDFMSGTKTLPLTYDSVFKKLFNPDVYPERLSRFISCVIGMPVIVVQILPQQESMLDGSALLIMDILVQLEDGSLANVEVQKIPYLFPGERMSCYSSDLVLRQYSRVKGERGSQFTYNDLKPVYTIVLFEKSLPEFRDPSLGGAYFHFGQTVFDTGLKLALLQKFYLISLDVFRETKYPKENNELTAWLSLLAVRNVDELDELLSIYPWLLDIYKDMAEYLHKPEEVLTMYSEALKILDRNTEQYMIEIMQKELDEKTITIKNQEAEIARLKAQLETTQSQ